MSQHIIRFKAGVTYCFVVKDDEHCILIDTGLKFSAADYLEVFRRNKINVADIKLVVVTHGHFDHFFNLTLIKNLTGAPVLCHSHAVPPLMTGQSAPIMPRSRIGKIMKRILPESDPSYMPVMPDIVVDGDYDLIPFGIKGKIVPTPGHSNCSISIILDTGEAFTGDMFMYNWFRRDRPMPAIFAVDHSQLQSSMQKVLDYGAATIYGSHGGVFNRSAIEALLKRLDR